MKNRKIATTLRKVDKDFILSLYSSGFRHRREIIMELPEYFSEDVGELGKKVKIILADDNRNLCKMLQEYLQSQEGFLVVGVAHDGLETLDLVRAHEPDLLVLDLVMPGLDGLGVLDELNAWAAGSRPKIIVLTAFGQESITSQAVQSGANYFLLKPFDLDILGKRIRLLTSETPPSALSPLKSGAVVPLPSGRGVNFNKSVNHNSLNHKSVNLNSMNLNIEATSMLHLLGIPAHIKGYQYIRQAILLAAEDMSLLGAVTKELYPVIAKKFDTEPGRVERGIRHAIELAWERGHAETMKRIFGYSMNIERQKPTNTEFIAHLADELRMMSNVN